MTTFKTHREIVADMVKRIHERGEQAVNSWKIKKSELIKGHNTVGRSIRDVYSLWDPKNPLCKGKHPDDVSMEIMESIWEELNGPPIQDMPKALGRVI